MKNDNDLFRFLMFVILGGAFMLALGKRAEYAKETCAKICAPMTADVRLSVPWTCSCK